VIGGGSHSFNTALIESRRILEMAEAISFV
jgi:hypothetical protein